MFSSSFTMSEQEHRQWTPYKHVAPALRDASLWHDLPPALLTRLGSTRPLLFRVREGRGKKLRGNLSEAQHALPDDGKRAQGDAR